MISTKGLSLSHVCRAVDKGLIEPEGHEVLRVVRVTEKKRAEAKFQRVFTVRANSCIRWFHADGGFASCCTRKLKTRKSFPFEVP